jgi:hypothetical protein
MKRGWRSLEAAKRGGSFKLSALRQQEINPEAKRD